MSARCSHCSSPLLPHKLDSCWVTSTCFPKVFCWISTSVLVYHTSTSWASLQKKQKNKHIYIYICVYPNTDGCLLLLLKNKAIETSLSRFIAVLDVDVCVASEQRCSSCCGGRPSVCVVTGWQRLYFTLLSLQHLLFTLINGTCLTRVQ